MISSTMAVPAAGAATAQRAEHARDARLARAGALVLDLVFVGMLSFIANNVYGVAQIASGAIPVSGVGTFEYRTITAIAWPWQALLFLAYFTIPEALFGATPGKHLIGLCVVRLDGAPLTLRDVLVRNLVRIADWLPILYLLGGALVLFGVNGQRLGDLVAGTTVVRSFDATEPNATRSTGPRTRRIAAIVLIAAVLYTAAFDYIGRPALIIQGMFNIRGFPAPTNAAFSLGTPQWGLGHVTYPITNGSCSGSITLRWGWLGWEEAGSQLLCSS